MILENDFVSGRFGLVDNYDQNLAITVLSLSPTLKTNLLVS